jgi:hypothetical protein
MVHLTLAGVCVGVGQVFHRHQLAATGRLLEDARNGLVGHENPGGLHVGTPFFLAGMPGGNRHA